MKQIAYILRTKLGRPLGFTHPEKFKEEFPDADVISGEVKS